MCEHANKIKCNKIQLRAPIQIIENWEKEEKKMPFSTYFCSCVAYYAIM